MKACGANFDNAASITRLIATSARIPGQNQFYQNKIANPSSQTAQCKLRQDPTNSRLFSRLLTIHIGSHQN